MSKRRVVVTGMGVISPVGSTINDFWSSLVNGKSNIGDITHFDASEFTTHFAGEVKDFDPAVYGIDPKKARRVDLFVSYAVAAAREAFDKSGLDMSKEDPFRCGTIIGSGIGGMTTIEAEHTKLLSKGPKRISPFLIPSMIIDMAAGEIAITYGFNGVNFSVVSACASSGHAIGSSLRAIQYGDADVMLAGGSEASVTPMGLGGFCSMKALSSRNDSPQTASRPFDAERDGFVMSEGAGMLLLEELEHAKNRGAEILAEVVGYGATADAYHMTAPHPEGLGGVNAMKAALKDAGLNSTDIDYFNAHGTSTPMNDKVETAVLKTVLGDKAKALPISSTKSVTGHMLGAAGAVEMIACIKTINEGIIPPTINYENPDPDCDLDYVPNIAREQKIDITASNSLGFGGHNSMLITKRFSG